MYKILRRKTDVISLFGHVMEEGNHHITFGIEITY